MSKSDGDDPIRLLSEPELEEYLRRDSEVSQRYRQLGGELGSRGVPAALDERILQQARQARARPKPAPRWRQWVAPLAIAASALLAVTVLLRTSPEDRVAAQAPMMPAPVVSEPPLQPAPEPVPSAEPPAASAELRDAPRMDVRERQPADVYEANAEKDASSRPARGDAASAERSREEARETRNYSTYSAPAAPTDRDEEPEQKLAEREQQGARSEERRLRQEQLGPATRMSEEREALAAAPPPPPPPQAAPVPQPSAPAAAIPVDSPRPITVDEKAKAETLQADRATPPQRLLERLRELRAQGKLEEAKALYKRLVEAHPSFQVPEKDIPK